MDGKALVQAFDHPITIERIQCWDEVPRIGDAGMHLADLRIDPIDASEAMRQLVELGYMHRQLTGDESNAMEIARVEWKYNLAASQLDAGRADAALPLIEELHAKRPGNQRFTMLLVQCYANLGRPGGCATDHRNGSERQRLDRTGRPVARMGSSRSRRRPRRSGSRIFAMA